MRSNARQLARDRTRSQQSFDRTEWIQRRRLSERQTAHTSTDMCRTSPPDVPLGYPPWLQKRRTFRKIGRLPPYPFRSSPFPLSPIPLLNSLLSLPMRLHPWTSWGVCESSLAVAVDKASQRTNDLVHIWVKKGSWWHQFLFFLYQ